MGGKLTHCVWSSSVIITQTTPKFSTIPHQPLNATIDNIDSLTTTSPTPTTVSSLDELFIFCQQGNIQGIESFFVLNVNESLLNATYGLSIAGIQMELSPLQTAACCGHEDVISHLLSFTTIQPNFRDAAYGMTALHLAIYLNHRFAVEILCRDGRVDPMQKNSEGKSCIQLAVEKNDISAVEAIFRLKPNLNLFCVDNEGNTLMHAASIYPNVQLFSKLLSFVQNTEWYGKDPESPSTAVQFMNIQNHYNETAVQILNRFIKLVRTETLTIFTDSHHEQKLHAINATIETDEENSPQPNKDDHRHFLMLEEERAWHLEQSIQCLALLHDAMHSCVLDEAFLQIDGDVITEASKFSIAAMSWSPKNEKFFLKTNHHSQNESHWSPLSTHID